MAELKMNNGSVFAADFMELYLKNRFGTMNKTELEELFYELMRRHTNLKELSDFDKSLILHMPVSRVRSLAFRSQLKYVPYNDATTKTAFFDALWLGHFEVVEVGGTKRIRIQLTDQYLHQYIKEKLSQVGAVPSATLDKDILEIDFSQFIHFAGSFFTENDKLELLKDEMVNKKKEQFGSFENILERYLLQEQAKEKIRPFIISLGKAVATNSLSVLLGTVE